MAEYSNFFNVYHFVPVENEVKRSKDTLKERIQADASQLYTGKIDVVLKTKTALFIPNVPEYEKKENEHKKYKFFSYDGITPVIPGSSLRGVIRSVYETISNSCLSVVDLDDRPVRRTSEVYTPALLGYNEEGQIVLYKAGKATIKQVNRPDFRTNVTPQEKAQYVEGARVVCRKPEKQGLQLVTREVRPWNSKLAKNDEWTEGFYFKGEPGINKVNNPRKEKRSLNAYVFYFTDKTPIPVVENRIFERNGLELQELKHVLDSYEENLELTMTRGYQGYKEYAKQFALFLSRRIENLPVHYSIVGDYIYLSPASITKEVYYTTAQQILMEQGKHDTCKDYKTLCPACKLFGMIGSENKDVNCDYPNAWASSVRIQDAVLKNGMNDKVFMSKEVTLMELASPKRSSTEFYLQKPNVVAGEKVLSWTYDYYTRKRDNNSAEVVPYMPKLSGRKFYWHHKMAKLPGDIEETKRNCSVTPVRQNTEFKFTVNFEKITKEQLDQLIWICNISRLKNEKETYGYKLGKGKPLGLGSIELGVEKVQIRKLKDDKGNIGFVMKDYKDEFGQAYEDISYEDAHFDTSVKIPFLKMCNFNEVGNVPVTYPVSDGQSVKVAAEGYRWFLYNHYNTARGGNGKLTKREELEFQQYLKSLSTTKDVSLRVNMENKAGSAGMHLKNDKALANDSSGTLQNNQEYARRLGSQNGQPTGNRVRQGNLYQQGKNKKNNKK